MTVIPDHAPPAGVVAVECFVIAGPEDLPSVPNLLRQASFAIAEQIGTPPSSSPLN